MPNQHAMEVELQAVLTWTLDETHYFLACLMTPSQLRDVHT